jgi:hypothetical protein
MIGPFFALLGFVCGVLVARKRGGKPLDCLQYGAGYGVAFGLAGVFIGIALARFLVPHG